MSEKTIKSPTLCFDLDYIIYGSSFAAEKRTIEALHRPTNTVFPFANRTEMYGRGKELGGWLKETNIAREKAGLSPFLLEDFEITDIQSAEPVANVLHTVKSMVETPMAALEAKEMKGFIGGKDVPLERWKRSTLLEYKGNRKDALSPIYKQEVTEYLLSKYPSILVNDGHEADDHVVMAAYGRDNHIVCGVDKDVYGNPVYAYNPNNPDRGVVDGRGFGSISWDEKKKTVEGQGRLFFYWQWLYGDDVDHYKANCMSDKKWGKKSAFNALESVRTDIEAFEVIRDSYKLLYPEKKIVTGWRGNEIEIDWLYVADEIWDMARMKRWKGDNVTASEVFEKYKLT